MLKMVLLAVRRGLKSDTDSDYSFDDSDYEENYDWLSVLPAESLLNLPPEPGLILLHLFLRVLHLIYQIHPNFPTLMMKMVIQRTMTTRMVVMEKKAVRRISPCLGNHLKVN